MTGRPRAVHAAIMYAVEPGHVGGLELSRRFYREVVQPLLNHHSGPLTHTAAIIGTFLGHHTRLPPVGAGDTRHMAPGARPPSD